MASPDEVKKPMTPCLTYIAENRKRIRARADLQGKGLGAISKKGAELFNALPDEEKKSYQDKYEERMKAYKQWSQSDAGKTILAAKKEDARCKKAEKKDKLAKAAAKKAEKEAKKAEKSAAKESKKESETPEKDLKAAPDAEKSLSKKRKRDKSEEHKEAPKDEAVTSKAAQKKKKKSDREDRAEDVSTQNEVANNSKAETPLLEEPVREKPVAEKQSKKNKDKREDKKAESSVQNLPPHAKQVEDPIEAAEAVARAPGAMTEKVAHVQGKDGKTDGKEDKIAQDAPVEKPPLTEQVRQDGKSAKKKKKKKVEQAEATPPKGAPNLASTEPTLAAEASATASAEQSDVAKESKAREQLAVGTKVKYWSNTHSVWIEAVWIETRITRVNPDGTIDVKGKLRAKPDLIKPVHAAASDDGWKRAIDDVLHAANGELHWERLRDAAVIRWRRSAHGDTADDIAGLSEEDLGLHALASIPDAYLSQDDALVRAPQRA